MNWNHKLATAINPTFQTPRADNTSLVSPEIQQASELLLANSSQFQSANSMPLADTTFGELRNAVRRRLLILAREWHQRTLHINDNHPASCACTQRQATMLARVDDLVSSAERTSAPLIVGGHQPELFHNGVWFKNAVISNIANSEQGIAINLVIDSDVPKHLAINVPTMTEDATVGLRTVSPIRTTANVPWEMLDQYATGNSKFDQEIRDLCVDLLSYEPMVGEYWNYFQEYVDLGFKLGHSLAISRHRIELDHGWNTLEVPFSQLCDSPEFGTFVSEVVARADEMRDVYNAARETYRKDHHIRNEAHPVPQLTQFESDGVLWCELPFWIYSLDIPNRQGLWLCHKDDKYWLSDRNQSHEGIELGESPVLSSDLWSKIVARGVKIRPRALMTTTFLRLFAADLFVHGIGGGKYDQVTNQIIRNFWKVSPPEYIVASASLHLPMFAKSMAPSHSENELQELIRETRFHPEKLLLKESSNLSAQVRELIQQKLDLIQDLQSIEDKAAWHQTLEKVNQALSEHLVQYRNRLDQQVEEARFNQRQQRLLDSREYSFVLFSKRNALCRLDELLPEVFQEHPMPSKAM